MKAQRPVRERGEIVPAGLHQARVYSVIQIGTVKTSWEGKEKLTPQVRIALELPEELKTIEFKDGKKEKRPQVVGRKFTLSMGKKGHLRPFIEGLLGKKFKDDEDAYDFEISDIIGKVGMVNMVHSESEKTGDTYANIASISPLPKKMKAKLAVNPPVLLSYENWDWEIFNKLPDFIKGEIMSSQEFAKLKKPKGVEYPQDTGDGVPF